MTGTAETAEAGEFWDIYKLDVMVIPTNRPIVRDDRQDLVFKTKREKYNAVIESSWFGSIRKVALPWWEQPRWRFPNCLSKMLNIRKINHKC